MDAAVERCAVGQCTVNSMAAEAGRCSLPGARGAAAGNGRSRVACRDDGQGRFIVIIHAPAIPWQLQSKLRMHRQLHRQDCTAICLSPFSEHGTMADPSMECAGSQVTWAELPGLHMSHAPAGTGEGLTMVTGSLEVAPMDTSPNS